MKVSFHNLKILEGLEKSLLPIGDEVKANYVMTICALLIDIKINGAAVRKCTNKPADKEGWKFRPPFGESNDGGITLRIVLRKSPNWEAHYYYERPESFTPRELLRLYQASIPPLVKNQLLSETWGHSIEGCYRQDLSAIGFVTNMQKEMMWNLFEHAMSEVSLMNWDEVEMKGTLAYRKLLKALPIDNPNMPQPINRPRRLLTPLK